MLHEINLKSSQRDEMIDITRQVRNIIRDSGVENGLAVIYAAHTTAGITINENADPDVQHDILLALEKAVPWRSPEYRHDEGNSAAHVKASMMGAGLTLIIREGRPQLGTWQSVFFCEFDGPRHRNVWALPLPETTP